MSVLAAASGSERFEVEASFEGELDLLELTKQTQCLLNTSTVERHTSASPTHTAAEDHQKRVEERLEELTMDSVLKSVPYYTPLTSGVVPARQLLALLEFTIPEYVQGSTADSIGQEELYNILILLESRLIEFTAKECIYLSTVLRPLLKSSADQLIQVSMALILKGLYIHKNTLRRYHSLVAIKIIQRVCPEDAELRS
ncbi:hypothetical protein AGDE_13451 [Angomonas deanei]|uniref:Uncharacterized protein n=1 Tax=Angomonas deanei TaxID=59799 RepID=A0A7G2CP34_9TRYP|nr:hypothetical protein AGDE_13451 [Angomonas deanei]CAD2219942.1 hypothetical protein, conserved [Angomonas deanei]|eukprot:EPY22292.1 hypothetical protein AGDE_13451 [Angomonas deanei]